jgi:hypothetical protein
MLQFLEIKPLRLYSYIILKKIVGCIPSFGMVILGQVSARAKFSKQGAVLGKQSESMAHRSLIIVKLILVDEVKVPHRKMGLTDSKPQSGKSEDQRMPSRIATILFLCPFKLCCDKTIR